MATQLLGTNANNSIPFALTFSPVNAVADVATIQQHILNDANRLQIEPGGLVEGRFAVCAEPRFPSHSTRRRGGR